jgi:hypothetical protein
LINNLSSCLLYGPKQKETKMPSPQKITTENSEYTEKEEFDTLTGDIIGAAIEVHRALGP